MPKDTLHVVFNIDSRYVRFCAVTMASIFANNPGEVIACHIVTDGLKPEEERTLRDLAAPHGGTVSFYTPDPALLQGFTIRKFSKRISLATYYRCILSALLPEAVHRCIYLDCDLLVLGALRPFYETDLQGAGVGVVEDIGADDMERYERMQYPPADSYFNAGVLLVDLDYWRKHDIAAASVRYYHDYPERIHFNDQDILNALFHDCKRFVPLKYNAQDGFYRPLSRLDAKWRTEHEEDLRRPVILHFTNRKPWDYDNQHPLRHLFFTYQDLTPWRGLSPLRTPLDWAKRVLRLWPFFLGLRKPKYIKLY